MDRAYGLSRQVKCVFLILVMGITLLNFQNCGRAFEAISLDSESGPSPDTILCNGGSCVTPVTPTSCVFNDVILQSGESVTAFFAEQAPDCVSETRRCDNGFLHGNYQFESCTPTGVSSSSCAWTEGIVANGQTVTAYRSRVVAEGEVCDQELRLCSNGVLSGSYTNPTCTVGDSNSCTLAGVTVLDGSSIVAFQNPSVPFGSQCVSQLRDCSEGVLSGTFNHTNCSVDQFLSCYFQGNFVDHGESIIAFQTSSVPYGDSCVQESRTCSDGALSGSYAHRTCQVGAPATCTFNGVDVAHGETVTAYLNSNQEFGESCIAETRTCEDGVLSGSHTFASCAIAEPNSCLFFGRTLAHGESATAFETSGVGFEESCTSEQRTCDNGTMGGSFNFETCTVAEPVACSFNAGSVAHGDSVTAFASGAVDYGDTCQSEIRTCHNGGLSGDFAFANCSVGAPSSCVVDGQTIAHNQIVNTYSQKRVPSSSTCTPMVEQCLDGEMTGSGLYLSCSVEIQSLAQLVDTPTTLTGNIVLSNPPLLINDGTRPLLNSDLMQCMGGTIDYNRSPGSADTISFGGQFIPLTLTLNANIEGDKIAPDDLRGSSEAARCSPGPAVSISNSIRVTSTLRITGQLTLDGVSLVIEDGGKLVVDSGVISVGPNSAKPSALYVMTGGELYMGTANSRLGLADIAGAPQNFGFIHSSGTIFFGANLAYPDMGAASSTSSGSSAAAQ